jgi:Na+-transporting NADH:ubiquinone oxidoreductase subunit A
MGQPRLHQINKGLELPINGAPNQHIKPGATVSKVALVADDYLYMKPSMRIKEGETVKRGQALFEDRKAPGAVFTAPAAGKVLEINRGERRKLLSVVIELNENELSGNVGDQDLQAYDSYRGADVSKYDLNSMKQLLSDSGLWTAIRVRPMSRVPALEENTEALFVTAMDSNPLAADTAVVLAGKEEDFALGLKALSLITKGSLYVCGAPKLKDTLVKATNGISNASVELFDGPHPAGLVGTHIHFVYPVNRERKAWHIGFQDVIAVGRLVKTGKLDVERVISIAGPAVFNPSLVQTRLGAEVAPLVKAFLPEREFRIIDGSALYGRTVNGSSAKTEGYLGRYRNQLTCLLEDRERVFFGWLIPGAEKFSVTRAFSSVFALGAFGGSKKFDFTTTTNGSHRAMVPIGMYERIMPLDIMPTFLLRSLAMDDMEKAEALGCLELDEEDLALCTFACPGKEDYGVALRRNLDVMWKEG